MVRPCSSATAGTWKHMDWRLLIRTVRAYSILIGRVYLAHPGRRDDQYVESADSSIHNFALFAYIVRSAKLAYIVGAPGTFEFALHEDCSRKSAFRRRFLML